MNRRSFNRLFALGGLSLVSGCIGHPLPPPKGTVIERSVVSESDGKRTPLLSVTEDGGEPSVGSVLKDRSIGPGFVLDEDLKSELSRTWENLAYYLKVRHEGYNGNRLAPADGSVKWYSTPLNQFDTTQVSDFVIIVTTITGSIGSFHRIIRDGTVVGKSMKAGTDALGDLETDEEKRYVTLRHAFGKTNIETAYLSSSDVYDDIETGGEYEFSVKRETSKHGTPYSYLDSLNPSHEYNVL